MDEPAENEATKRAPTLDDAARLLADADKALALAARIYDLAATKATGMARGRLRQNSWRAAQMRQGDRPRWFSQAGQDRYLDEEVFKGKRGGIFVDVGAYDGITGSNTLFFEVFRGWTGLLVEPAPDFAMEARSCRKAPLVEAAIGPEDGQAEFFHVTAGYTQMSGLAATYDPALKARVEADSRHQGRTIRVKTLRLATLFERHALAEVDFVSLDIEGGETAVLEDFDFARFPVRAWSIENNGGSDAIVAIMARAGYRLAEHIGVDEIYVLDRG